MNNSNDPTNPTNPINPSNPINSSNPSNSTNSNIKEPDNLINYNYIPVLNYPVLTDGHKYYYPNCFLNSYQDINNILNSNLSVLNNNLIIANQQLSDLKKEKDNLEIQIQNSKRKYESFDTDNKPKDFYDNNFYVATDNDKCKNNDKYMGHYENKYVDKYKNDTNNKHENKTNNRYKKKRYSETLETVEKPTNKYYIKKYSPHSQSWSEEKIKEYFKNLKNIKDIISIKDDWYKIRHNEKLSKLYNIIPPMQKLEKMIGLDSVKKEIFKILIYYIQNQHIDEYLHTVIIGPPGVGKTQIAKIYSEIFVRLGILKTDKFISIRRDDLVAEFLGQTSHRTKKLLESAMGGVIFLDEGYSLGNNEKRDSFAKEAIDMINQYLSERKKDFMFVIAGYEQELEDCFFSFNRGLKRRFSQWIKIEKYTKDELIKIFELKINESGYKLGSLLDKKELNIFF
jgi:SpoVK/Ycf46/Vps4 family AAA+-type ATPase